MNSYDLQNLKTGIQNLLGHVSSAGVIAGNISWSIGELITHISDQNSKIQQMEYEIRELKQDLSILHDMQYYRPVSDITVGSI